MSLLNVGQSNIVVAKRCTKMTTFPTSYWYIGEKGEGKTDIKRIRIKNEKRKDIL